MYNGMKLYRAVVSYVSGDDAYVTIPSLLGPSVSVSISKIFPHGVSAVGQQVIVAIEDDKVSNVHVIKVESV